MNRNVFPLIFRPELRFELLVKRVSQSSDIVVIFLRGRSGCPSGFIIHDRAPSEALYASRIGSVKPSPALGNRSGSNRFRTKVIDPHPSLLSARKGKER